MNSNKEIVSFDISKYTDYDLFELLDLNNPTDRELEAKLYSLIQKYNNVKSNIGKQFKNLYISIFNHFFETGNEEEEEENENENEEDKHEYTKNKENTINEGFETKISEINPEKNDEKPTYTKNIDYSKGNLNPILKETIKRVVSIDSSFRNTTSYPYSTDFTFNLSETLHDVVSLKLYSVSIPYNWYTINQNYGSNFFYINGNANGINNGYYNYKIDIPYGNYTAPQLIDAVNSSIQTNLIKTNPDIIFGSTEISYNSVNGRCSINLDIKNNYNETNYQLYFPYFTTDLSNNKQTKDSLPEIFGYKYNNYNPFTICSNPLNNNLQSYYKFDGNNNTFNIVIYQGVIDTNTNKVSSYVDSNTSTILKTIPITLFNSSIGNYTAQSIYNELNSQLKSNNNLISEYSDISFVDISGYTQIVNYNYKLSIKPNRKTTVNVPNQKIRIEFPTENSNPSPIWTSPSSCFQFPTLNMELQNTYSEINSYTTTYVVNTSPFIILNCIANGFQTDFTYTTATGYYNTQSLNDYKIDISNSSPTGYILSDYYTVIRNAFSYLNEVTNGQVILTTTNTLDPNFNTQISCNINKVIPKEYFYLDTTNSFLNTSFNFSTNLYSGLNTSQILPNLSFGVNNSNNTFKIYPCTYNGDNTMNYGDNKRMNPQPVTIAPGNYFLNDLINEINNIFQNYYILNNNNIDLKKSYINYTIIGDTINLTLNLNIEAKLTNKDYVLYFFDASSILENPNNPENLFTIYNCYKYGVQQDYTGDNLNYSWLDISNNPVSTNSWRNNFGFQDPSYNLSTNNIITGTKQNESNLLKLTDVNKTFQLIPLYDPSGGVYDDISSNIISYTLDLSSNVSYTKEQIRDAMNIQLNKVGSIAIGSYVDTSNPTTLIRLNINKIYTAKDYSVVFYDVNSFTKCNYGPNSSAETTTADTTLGWKMGFRTDTLYNLTPENLNTNILDGTTYYGNYISNPYTYDAISGIARLVGDTSVNVNLYNYFLIILDDYTQNHLNDGLVTTITSDLNVPLPSYATKASRKCIVTTNTNGVSNTSTYDNYNKLTNAQIYSSNQILNVQKTKYLNNVFSSGPFIQDIFGIIPVKIAGLSYGQTYSEFGGTLQIQERVYFGPVNISRMTVRIMTDKGNILDLNNQNWSFSLITEQLYNPNRG